MHTDPDSIARIAADLASTLPGSRVHGALTGGLCCGAPDDAGWWEHILDAAIGTLPLDQRLRRMLALTEAALADPDCGFEPLLPDEYASLSERVAALADWCDAFVLAFAAGRTARSATSDEDTELLADLNAIAAELDPEAVVSGGEDDEDDFMQLVECVRVAALSLFASREGEASGVHH
ncbi:MAG TPA: UPF0149 family protein [Pseudomonadales bacterium]|nr:UPF0149 family protein [Pseudomonadales bacterium]HNC69073.1 UPF0149 family protein [Pseudomonadales bacterium]HND13672.1 UPF0149 family protein [Pseudomonadales bacterium]